MRTKHCNDEQDGTWVRLDDAKRFAIVAENAKLLVMEADKTITNISVSLTFHTPSFYFFGKNSWRRTTTSRAA